MTTRSLQLTYSRLVVALVLLGGLALAARATVDGDTWWHLRAGGWMVVHRQVLEQDVFTSTFAGQPWSYPAWLSQAALYLVFNTFGYAGLKVLTAACVLAAMALVYAASAGSVSVRALAVLLAAAASAVAWAARPDLATLVLSAAYLLILERYRRQGRNQLWLLPLLMALWVNLDPGFVVGFLLIGLVLAGETLRAALGQQTWRAVGLLAAFGAVCGLALLLTPYGPVGLYRHFATVASAAWRDGLAGWQSPNFHVRGAQVFIGLWLLTLAAVGFSRTPIDATDFLLFSGASYLTLLDGRSLAIVALVAPPILSRHGSLALAAVWDQPWPGWLARWRPAPLTLPRYAGPARWLILGLAVVAALVWLGLAYNPQQNAQAATRNLPVGAADFLAQQTWPGPLYNPAEWGGYLEWRLYPTYPVLVDGRPDLYPQAFADDYQHLAAGAPEWQALLTRYQIRLVLAPTGSALAELVQAAPGWTQRYADAVAVVLTHN